MPASSDAWETNVRHARRQGPAESGELRPHEDRLRRRDAGVGVAHLGVDDQPPLRTSSGLTPKNAGFHSTRSAHLPGSMLPTCWAMPCVSAGLIVYLAT